MLIMEKKLAEIFSNIFKVEENKITDVVSPDNLENWDSLSHMDLVVSIEEEFSVRFSSDEIIGGYDEIKGKKIRIEGYLEEFSLSRKEADDLIMAARDIVYK